MSLFEAGPRYGHAWTLKTGLVHLKTRDREGFRVTRHREGKILTTKSGCDEAAVQMSLKWVEERGLLEQERT